jgi:hypothetical protein
VPYNEKIWKFPTDGGIVSKPVISEGAVLRHPGDPVEVAEMMADWQRVLTPTLGGLCAGLVLYYGLRLAGPQRSTNCWRWSWPGMAGCRSAAG